MNADGMVSGDVPDLKDYKTLYHELLYAVGNHYPGESRHETALRYIRRAEERSGQAASVRPASERPNTASSSD